MQERRVALTLTDTPRRPKITGIRRLLVAAVVLFTRPKVEYVLIGQTGGQVAVIEGTPSGPAATDKNGANDPPSTLGIDSMNAPGPSLAPETL